MVTVMILEANPALGVTNTIWTTRFVPSAARTEASLIRQPHNLSLIRVTIRDTVRLSGRTKGEFAVYNAPKLGKLMHTAPFGFLIKHLFSAI
jgi:hypothetical protein